MCVCVCVCVCVSVFCTSGLDRLCWFNQSDPCYAALGHKLTLRSAKQYEVKIQKNIDNKTADPVCRVKNDTKKDCDLYSNRTDVEVINGTLIINRAIREDSGNYTVTFSHSSGSQTSTDLQVNVEGTETLSSDSIQYSVLQTSPSLKSDESLWIFVFMQLIIKYLKGFSQIHQNFHVLRLNCTLPIVVTLLTHWTLHVYFSPAFTSAMHFV